MSKVSIPVAFCVPALSIARQQNLSPRPWTCSARGDEGFALSRRAVLTALAGLAVQIGVGNPSAAKAQGQEIVNEKTPASGFLTKSGLKYFDFEVGKGPTPKWGDFVNIKYVAYTISRSGEALVEQDASDNYGKDGYLIHHGNGEQIFGLEEAIHSMSAGGRRRAIIPSAIAYSNANLGPVPSADRKRRKFSDALKDSDGNVVFDIEVTAIWQDEQDRGYYNDLTPTPEEMMRIMNSDEEEWTA